MMNLNETACQFTRVGGRISLESLLEIYCAVEFLSFGELKTAEICMLLHDVRDEE